MQETAMPNVAPRKATDRYTSTRVYAGVKVYASADAERVTERARKALERQKRKDLPRK